MSNYWSEKELDLYEDPLREIAFAHYVAGNLDASELLYLYLNENHNYTTKIYEPSSRLSTEAATDKDFTEIHGQVVHNLHESYHVRAPRSQNFIHKKWKLDESRNLEYSVNGISGFTLNLDYTKPETKTEWDVIAQDGTKYHKTHYTREVILKYEIGDRWEFTEQDINKGGLTGTLGWFGYQLEQAGKAKPFTTKIQIEKSETLSVTLCLAPGTLIRTPSGNRLVEELQIGDLVLTPDGPLPLKFMGIFTRHVNILKASGRMPIRIQAGVFGHNLPSADIYCTPSHAFTLGDCLVEAQALLNGQSIYQLEELSEYDQRHQVEQCSPSAEQKEVAVAVAMADSFTYYSLEFEQHVLVWANDLLTESYLPTYRDGELTRVAWNNYDHYLRLYGSSKTMEELPMSRIPFSRQLPLRIREQFGLVSSYGPSSACISGSSPSSADASREELCLTL
jgi:hypothetical protein